MTVAHVLGQGIVIIAVAVGGPWLIRRRFALIQAAGAVAMIVTGLLVLLLPAYVPRWGMFRIGSDTAVYEPATTRILFVFLAILYFVAIFLSNRRWGSINDG